MSELSEEFKETRLEVETEDPSPRQAPCRWLEQLLRKLVEICRAAPGLRTE